MEELKNNGFINTYCLTLVQDHNFYSGKKVHGIYSYFRDDKLLAGIIQKPTGKKNEVISLAGNYIIHWETKNNWSYYIIEI